MKGVIKKQKQRRGEIQKGYVREKQHSTHDVAQFNHFPQIDESRLKILSYFNYLRD